MLKASFYGDDFTGASDNAAQFARHGLRTVLFFGLPDDFEELRRSAEVSDVIGIAGVARSLRTAQMEAELAPSLDALISLGTPLVQYKCCSTLDSTAEIGSLGEATRVLRKRLPGAFMPVLAAVPEFARYTVFGTHFAAAGEAVYRLDRHPTMSRHPVTPAFEADIRRHFGNQGAEIRRLVDVRELERFEAAPEALAMALTAESDTAVFDTLSEAHLVTAAATIWQIAQNRGVATVSAQGLAHGLGLHWQRSGLIEGATRTHSLVPVDRLFVLSGSCSPNSAAQISWAEKNGFVSFRLAPEVLVGDGVMLEDAARKMLDALQAGRSVVVYTARGPDDPALAQTHALYAGATGSGMSLTEHMGAIIARLARMAITQAGVRRFVVAGGDSSSFAMRHLGASAMAMETSHFRQNAHIGRLRSPDPEVDGVEVLLKGGQVGTAEIYGIIRDGFSSS
jgi:3-oxoisoapionate kinase